MSDSQVIDWLPENSYRAYPLVRDTNRTANTSYVLGDDVIVDVLLVTSSVVTNVTLNTIVADNTNVVFNLSSSISFTVARGATFPAYIRLANGCLLVVNKVSDIPNGTHTFTNLYFEKSVCMEFGAEWLGVTTLQFDSSAALTGVITLKEGYQFGITSTISTLDFWADSNYGLPLGCYTLGTDNDCSSIISYVNGAGPSSNVLKFTRGNDMVILEDPTNHRIFIGLTFNPDDICKTIPINPDL